jgi:hypothetical protein
MLIFPGWILKLAQSYFRGFIGGNGFQKIPAKAFPTNWGLLFNHKDPPIHAREFRESWRAWPHEGRIQTLFMICIQVGIARTFEIDVAHVWNYTT